MNRRQNRFYQAAAITMAVSLLAAGAVFAEETETATENSEVTVTAREAQETPDIPILGEESENALKLQITNKTGKAITWIAVYEFDPDADPNADIVRMQEALIEQEYLDDTADGLYGPKTSAAVIAFREANGLSGEDLADKEMLTLLYGEYEKPFKMEISYERRGADFRRRNGYSFLCS